jgi:DNA helicase II / ATP-dependent DNA helicase PcrA
LASKAKRISVIAAPGSGKTKRAIIPKVQQVLEDTSVDPKNVLLLTFSRLSAKDLKERVNSLERSPRALTVHSLCLAFLLSENNHDMRKRVESILLEFEKDTLISDLKLVFPQKPKPDLKKMLKAFSAGWATQPHDDVFEEDAEKRSFKAAIINWLNEHEAVMMDEIVYGAVDLARKVGTTDFLQSPQYIFVDEYQDLNKLEQEFIEILAAESKLLLVVGDPDQSIYSFKYSYPNGIKDYATRQDVEAYSSLKTGRCPKEVVEIANQLLLQAEPARTNLLESVREDAGEVHFIRKNTQGGEFAYALRSIAQRLEGGSSAKSIMVLVPKTQLGAAFVEYAQAHKDEVGIAPETSFKFDSKTKLTELEQERILLFGLLSRPESILHLRAYLGLGDDNSNAAEVRLLKEKYGDLVNALATADPEDFS